MSKNDGAHLTDEQMIERANSLQAVLTGMEIGQSMDVLMTVFTAIVNQMDDDTKFHALTITNRVVMKLMMGEEAMAQMEAELEQTINEMVGGEAPTKH